MAAHDHESNDPFDRFSQPSIVVQLIKIVSNTHVFIFDYLDVGYDIVLLALGENIHFQTFGNEILHTLIPLYFRRVRLGEVIET